LGYPPQGSSDSGEIEWRDVPIVSVGPGNIGGEFQREVGGRGSRRVGG